jgi:chaperonin GroES
VQAGDNVLYAKYAGTELRIGEDDHVIMKEADVIGIQGDSIPTMKPLQVRT